MSKDDGVKQHWFSKSGSKNPNNIANPATDDGPQQSKWQRGMSPKHWGHVLRMNLKPSKNVKGNPTFAQSLRAVVFATWLNVLLIFIPISWAIHFVPAAGPVPKFVTAFFAIIPLAKLLGFATEELSLRVGQTIGGLLNATLGNAVELIVAIIALTKCELAIVQSSLVGSILSNLLLVLGMCFFAGGTRFSEQGFAAAASQLNSSLLVVSVIAVLLPAAFHFTTSRDLDSDEPTDILRLSHGVAIILLVTYGAYLVFQLWSHAHLYDDDSEDNFKSRKFPNGQPSGQGTGAATNGPTTVTARQNNQGNRDDQGDNFESGTELNPPSGFGNSTDVEKQNPPDEDDEEVPQLSVVMSLVTLAVVTVLVAVTAEFLVDSINGLTASTNISKEWVGLILLPIVGNAAEHVTAVTVSVKDKLTLSLGVAAGSSIQIALFVIPFMVVLAWIIGKPLTLLFDPFESITLFLAVITVNYVTADGKTNWLEGLILMNLYFIIGVTFWFYPGNQLTCSGPQ